jgi:hypothetical protein
LYNFPVEKPADIMYNRRIVQIEEL